MASTKKVPKNIGQWGVLPKWIICHPELPANAKLLVAALTVTEGDDGIFPSNTTLAALIGVAEEKSVRRLLVKLEALGIVQRQPRATKSGRQTSNLFKLDLTEPSKRISLPPRPTGGSVRKWKKHV